MIETRYVVMTSINPPGKSAAALARWEGWKVIVVGDRKTPDDWDLEGVTYLGIDRQHDILGEFSRAIPENSYVRKMIGYAYAIQHGASAIFETDDDNLPYHDAPGVLDAAIKEKSTAGHESRRSGNRWVNIYQIFGAPHCWPRGFPLEYVKYSAYDSGSGNTRPAAITQFLVDGDPDVDAVYRMIDGRPVHFPRGLRVMLDPGMYCPINSQATLWKPSGYALMFLPVGVSDRVTDILRGYIAQACLWKVGYGVSYASPILFQARNFHELPKDFALEVPLYVNARAWADALLDVRGYMMVGLYRSALEILVKAGAIPEVNIELYEKYIKAIRMGGDDD